MLISMLIHPRGKFCKLQSRFISNSVAFLTIFSFISNHCCTTNSNKEPGVFWTILGSTASGISRLLKYSSSKNARFRSVVFSTYSLIMRSRDIEHATAYTATYSLNVNIRSATRVTVRKKVVWCIATATRKSDHMLSSAGLLSCWNGLTAGPLGRATPITPARRLSTDRVDDCRPHSPKRGIWFMANRSSSSRSIRRIFTTVWQPGSHLSSLAWPRDDGFITGPCSGLGRRCPQLRRASATAALSNQLELSQRTLPAAVPRTTVIERRVKGRFCSFTDVPTLTSQSRVGYTGRRRRLEPLFLGLATYLRPICTDMGFVLKYLWFTRDVKLGH